MIIDLEDAVVDDAKAQARAAAVGWIAGGGRAVVRINADPDRAHQDLTALSAVARIPGLAAIMVPKAEEPGQIVQVVDSLGDVPVIALIETATGIAQARDLARVPGVLRLAIGSLDLAVDMSIDEDSHAMAAARWEIVLASRLAGLPAPLDTVTPVIGDGTAAGEAAARARANGFSGKLCIHPAQVASVNAAFVPSTTEIDWARRVVEAAEASAVTRIDGAMIDKPVIDRARQLLADARHEATDREVIPA